jgi:hypothetical protein
MSNPTKPKRSRRGPRLRAPRFLTGAERFSIVTIVVIMLVAFVPAAAIIYYANGQLKGMASTQDVALLERYRDEQILRLQDEYALVSSQMTSYGAQVTFGGNGRPVAPEETFVPENVRATYWFDPSFAFGGVLKSGVEADVTDMSTRLASTAFTSPVIFGDWVDINGEPFQNAFLRLADTSGVIGYVGYVLDSGIVSESVDSDSQGYVTSVFDGNFDIIYSTDVSLIGERRVDEITKDMLAGNVATATQDGKSIAYGFVDVVASPLYVEVTQIQTVNAAKAANALRFMGFILIFFMVIAFVVAWRYLRRVQRFADARTAPGFTGRRRRARSAITAFLEDADDWDVRLEGMTREFRGFRANLTALRDELGSTPADAVSHDKDMTEPDAGEGERSD